MGQEAQGPRGEARRIPKAGMTVVGWARVPPPTARRDRTGGLPSFSLYPQHRFASLTGTEATESCRAPALAGSRLCLDLSHSRFQRTVPVGDLIHRLFGAHVPDPACNRWDRGHFVSACAVCGRDMIRLPGLPWRAGKPD